MPIEDHGVTAKYVEDALMHVRAGHWPPIYNIPSKTTYILWEGELWDFKPVVAKAFELAGSSMAKDLNWKTGDFRGDLIRIGFPVVVFRKSRPRGLGIAGFRGDELNEKHEVLLPPDGRKVNDAMISFDDVEDGVPQRLGLVSYVIRDPKVRRQCLEEAKGVCQSCGKKTFQTSYGEWYLEVHHKKWLREGGYDRLENVIALCANCHRQEHYGTDRRYY